VVFPKYFAVVAAMPPSFVGDKASVATKFRHHGSVRHLWNDEWKLACQRGAYPFNEGANFCDFEPIFQALIEISLPLRM
jgi:hypothetical protein